MDAELQARLEHDLSVHITGTERVRGGDINDAYRVHAASGESFFVKAHRRAPEGMFRFEAEGLARIRSAVEGSDVRVPSVHAVRDDYLTLEDLGHGPPGPEHDAQLAAGLALLHTPIAEQAGLEHGRAGYIATLPQSNAPAPWPNFYAQQRLAPLVAAARLGADWTRDFSLLYERLPDLIGDAPLSLLHGDLWSGNAHVCADGSPALVDPAHYIGDREVDLAMMRLFGGFSTQFWSLYDRAMPMRPGWRARVPLYQLYPLLVHVNLFGSGYLGQLRQALDASLRLQR